MAKLPLVTEDEGEIQDLGELARNLRLALLVTDAVLPLPNLPDAKLGDWAALRWTRASCVASPSGWCCAS